MRFEVMRSGSEALVDSDLEGEGWKKSRKKGVISSLLWMQDLEDPRFYPDPTRLELDRSFGKAVGEGEPRLR